MSGLFTRLARHAVGQPRNLVRAASPMPYQQSSELAPTEPAYLQSETASDRVAVNSRSTANPQATANSQSTDELASPSAFVTPSDARTMAGLANKAGRLQSPDFSEQPGNDRIEARPTMSDSAGEPLVPLQVADPISQADDSAAVMTSADNGGVIDHQQDYDLQPVSAALAMDKIIVETQVDNQTQDFGVSHQQQTSQADVSPTGPRAPEPLLPSHAAAPTANSVAAMQTPAATSEAPNEVHVHIGRIEVTAVQSSEPPRRKAKAAQQPMSLNDYLARRQRS